MPFRFTLEAVLRLRENQEHREYLLLERIQQEVLQAQAHLTKVEHALREAEGATAVALSEGIHSVHLQDCRDRESLLRKHRAESRSTLDRLLTQSAKQLALYRRARQKREIMESLRAQQRLAYDIQQGKLEQAALDEIFLARRRRTE